MCNYFRINSTYTPRIPQHYRRTDGRTDGQLTIALVGAYARSPARTQQKTSALGKPDADLFIARTDANQRAKVTVPSCKLGNIALAVHASRGKKVNFKQKVTAEMAVSVKYAFYAGSDLGRIG